MPGDSGVDSEGEGRTPGLRAGVDGSGSGASSLPARPVIGGAARGAPPRIVAPVDRRTGTRSRGRVKLPVTGGQGNKTPQAKDGPILARPSFGRLGSGSAPPAGSDPSLRCRLDRAPRAPDPSLRPRATRQTSRPRPRPTGEVPL